MENKNLSQKSKSDIFGAGTTGWGYGTIVAFFINEMSTISPYKPYLIVLTPLITIGISGLWFIWKTQYFDSWLIDMEIARLERYLSKAQSRMEIVNVDANSTEEYKKQVHKIVEEIQMELLKLINHNDNSNSTS